jgi:glyoxylase-like metal-dependent hydrolase (beta-lactamase superfamily II)
MTNVSRRTLVLSAAAASAVFGLDKKIAFIGTAEAQQKAPSLLDKGFVKFKVGDIQVTQIYDGIWQKAHDPGFVKNASLDDVKAALAKANVTQDHVPITFTVTVIKSKGKTLMFDSSTGGQLAPTAGLMMAKNMYKAGIEPSKITNIAVTHFHGDHISGMISKETNSRVFPDADIAVPSEEYKFWTDPATIQKLPEGARGNANRIQATFPKWKNMRQIEDNAEVIPGVRAMAMYGHTPGHTGYVVTSGNQRLYISSDITNIPSLFVRNPGWHAVFDMDAQAAEATRRKVFTRVIAEKALINGYHWGLPGVGKIKRDGNSYAFVPLVA